MDDNSIKTNQENTAITHEMLATLRNDVAALHEKVEAIQTAQANKTWDILKLVLPIVLTAVLGLMVWYFQNQIQKNADEHNREIQAKVDENNRLLSTRLALTEEFYKRKLAEYEKVGIVIAKLREALDRYDELEVDPEIGAQASDNTNAVRVLKESDFLFFSSKFRDKLDELWIIGVHVIGKRELEADVKTNLADLIKSLRDEMNTDLHTSDLSWPQQSEK